VAPASRLIFQLGTTNWQRHGEQATREGIRHRACHSAFNQLPGSASYSLWPSPQAQVGRPDLQVFEVGEDSSVQQSMAGDYQWHKMSTADFGRYRQRLAFSLHSWMAEVEAAEGAAVSTLVAHDGLLSPIVLNDVQRRRAIEGLPPCQVMCFVDRASLDLFRCEQDGLNAMTHPYRFLPMIEALGVLDAADPSSFGVDLWVMNSAADYYLLNDLFPDVPIESLIVSHGYDPAIFAPRPGRFEHRNDYLAAFTTMASIDGDRPAEAVARPSGFDGVVVTGALAVSHSRLDAVLRAAAHYEAGEAVVATVIFGLDDEDGRGDLETLAWDHLGLKNVFFVGRQTQTQLAALFDCADVAVFPSTAAGDDQVLIECLGCATPVIGVESGSGADLISDPIGSLVANSDDSAELAVTLGSAVATSINYRWKYTKGPVAAEWVAAHFGVRRQVESIHSAVLAWSMSRRKIPLTVGRSPGVGSICRARLPLQLRVVRLPRATCSRSLASPGFRPRSVRRI